jgi:hypothetical protein
MGRHWAIKDIGEQKEANLTFRARFRTKANANTTFTLRYHLLLFPSGEPSTATKQ